MPSLLASGITLRISVMDRSQTCSCVSFGPLHFARHEQHRRTTHRLRFANRRLQSRAAFVTRSFVRRRQPLVPMLIINHPVHRQLQFAARLAQPGDVHPRRTAFDAIKTQFLELLHPLQIHSSAKFCGLKNKPLICTLTFFVNSLKLRSSRHSRSRPGRLNKSASIHFCVS